MHRLELRAARALALRDYKRTIRCLEELLGEVGENPHTLHMLAHCHERLGAADQAIAYAERALSVDPDHTGGLQVLSRVYVRQEDFARAHEYVTRALENVAASGEGEPRRGGFKAFLRRAFSSGRGRGAGAVDPQWVEWAEAFRRWYEETDGRESKPD